MIQKVSLEAFCELSQTQGLTHFVLPDQVRVKVGGDDVEREGVHCAKICGQGGRRRDVSPDDCSNCLQDEVVTVVVPPGIPGHRAIVQDM